MGCQSNFVSFMFLRIFIQCKDYLITESDILIWLVFFSASARNQITAIFEPRCFLYSNLSITSKTNYCLEVQKILDKILKVKLCYLIHSLSFDTVTLYLLGMNGFKAISKHCLPSRPMYLCLVFFSPFCVFTTSKREIRQNMYLGFDTNLHNCRP